MKIFIKMRLKVFIKKVVAFSIVTAFKIIYFGAFINLWDGFLEAKLSEIMLNNNLISCCDIKDKIEQYSLDTILIKI